MVVVVVCGEQQWRQCHHCASWAALLSLSYHAGSGQLCCFIVAVVVLLSHLPVVA